MTTTTTTTPASDEVRRDRVGFPLDDCGRCGGSGRFSWNPTHLDMCYGCGGSGVTYARGAGPAVAAYRQACTAAREVLALDITGGDTVEPWWGTTPLPGTGGLRTERGETRTVGSTHYAGPVDGGGTVTLCFTDGTTATCAATQVWFRVGYQRVDPAPFVARAERTVAWARTQPRRRRDDD